LMFAKPDFRATVERKADTQPPLAAVRIVISPNRRLIGIRPPEYRTFSFPMKTLICGCGRTWPCSVDRTVVLTVVALENLEMSERTAIIL
jgi:hypothetical protein